MFKINVIWFILLVCFILIFKIVYKEHFSGGSNIQLNSNSVDDYDNEMINNNMKNKIKENENFSCGCKKNKMQENFSCGCKKYNTVEKFKCNKSWNEDFNNENKYVNINAYIVSSDYVQKKIK